MQYSLPPCWGERGRREGEGDGGREGRWRRGGKREEKEGGGGREEGREGEMEGGREEGREGKKKRRGERNGVGKWGVSEGEGRDKEWLIVNSHANNETGS